VAAAFSALWAATFASGTQPHFEHGFGAFDAFQPLAAVDRLCFRLPDALSADAGARRKKEKEKEDKGDTSTSTSVGAGRDKPLQRCLAPHLDCCPHTPLAAASKWRPVQAFVSLVDTAGPDLGGFECCPGHHRGFAQWATTRAPAASASASARGGGGAGSAPHAPCVGAFTPMRPLEDADVLARFETVPCKAGDLVRLSLSLSLSLSLCVCMCV
jgi:hypothetical protein